MQRRPERILRQNAGRPLEPSRLSAKYRSDRAPRSIVLFGAGAWLLTEGLCEKLFGAVLEMRTDARGKLQMRDAAMRDSLAGRCAKQRSPIIDETMYQLLADYRRG